MQSRNSATSPYTFVMVRHLVTSGHIGTRPEIAGLRVQRADHLITPPQRGAFEGP